MAVHRSNIEIAEWYPNSNMTMAMRASIDASKRLQFVRLAGRGSSSMVAQVRFGLSTTLIKSFDLPATFEGIIALQAPQAVATPKRPAQSPPRSTTRRLS